MQFSSHKVVTVTICSESNRKMRTYDLTVLMWELSNCGPYRMICECNFSLLRVVIATICSEVNRKTRTYLNVLMWKLGTLSHDLRNDAKKFFAQSVHGDAEFYFYVGSSVYAALL